MDGPRRPNHRLAHQQWTRLQATLIEQVGASVLTMDTISGLPDMIFTANAGLIYKEQTILSDFRHAERQREAVHFRRWFEKHG